MSNFSPWWSSVASKSFLLRHTFNNLNTDFNLTLSKLADVKQLSTCLSGAKRRWESNDQIVTTTLWWYSASYFLIGTVFATWLLTNRAALITDEAPLQIRDSDGYINCWNPITHTDDLHEAIVAMCNYCEKIIEILCQITPTKSRALWAIAGDVPAMTATQICGEQALINERIATWKYLENFHQIFSTHISLPKLRWKLATGEIPNEVLTAPVQENRAPSPILRSSCCLLHKVPKGKKCLSCPKQITRNIN